MKDATFLLVDQNVLPPVFRKVLEAKQYLLNAEASSTSEAARMAGISRSVFYKYKDAVYPYQNTSLNRIITIQMVLYDKPGVLMAAAGVFTSMGANILTINQNIPVNGKDLVSISARIDQMNGSLSDLLNRLGRLDGITALQNISDET